MYSWVQFAFGWFSGLCVGPSVFCSFVSPQVCMLAYCLDLLYRVQGCVHLWAVPLKGHAVAALAADFCHGSEVWQSCIAAAGDTVMKEGQRCRWVSGIVLCWGFAVPAVCRVYM
jgi:hypothetical protein